MEEDGRIIATITLRMPWGKQPGPYGVPHIWWFAVDPDTGKKESEQSCFNGWRKQSFAIR